MREKRVLKHILHRRPLLRIRVQHLRQKIPQPRRKPERNSQRLLRQLARRHLKERHAERPNIRLERAERLAAQDLRRKKTQRPAHVLDELRLRHKRAQTKVAELRSPVIRHEDVRGLHVAVCDSLVMAIREGRRERLHDASDAHFLELVVCDHVEERALVAQLENQEHVIVRGEILEKLDDVGMVERHKCGQFAVPEEPVLIDHRGIKGRHLRAVENIVALALHEVAFGVGTRTDLLHENIVVELEREEFGKRLLHVNFCGLVSGKES